jgi:hypothetical protein
MNCYDNSNLLKINLNKHIMVIILIFVTVMKETVPYEKKTS